MKKHLLIYPTPKNYKKINTHANVCSFFLNKYLRKYYNVHKSSDLSDSPEWIKEEIKKEYGTKKRRRAMVAMVLKHIKNDGHKLDYCITTIQRGFAKIEEEKIDEIRIDNPHIKLCSIHDHYGVQKYNEDFLFIAKKIPSNKHLLALKRGANNKDIKPVYIGWCADHKLFNPKPKKDDVFNIVLDHAAFQEFRTDATDLYIKAILRLKKRHPDKTINLCRLHKGFEFYNFNDNTWTHDLSFRWWKSDYDNDKGIENGSGCNIFQIAECLSNTHVFGVTHVESCGLTGIEALMGGAKLYIPRGRDKFVIWGSQGKGKENLGPYKNVAVGRYNGSFIKKELLRPYMDYTIFESDSTEIYLQLDRDITSYKNISNRGKLVLNNSWMKAAERIYEGLENG